MKPFQKFQTWHLKDRKFNFYVKGIDELMKMEIIKEKGKGFYVSNTSYDVWQKVGSYKTVLEQFWNISKLAIVCSKTPFSKNSYYTETSHIFCNAKQLAGFKTIHIFKESCFQTDINPIPANVPVMDKPGSWFLVAKCGGKTPRRVIDRSLTCIFT